MSERLVKRYHMCGASCLREQPKGSPDGLFVLYDDFVVLAAKCEGLKQERDHLLGAILLSKIAHEKADAREAKLTVVAELAWELGDRHCETIGAMKAHVVKLREALTDMRSGWRYIREFHGDLYGVAWDRCEQSATAALADPEA